MFSGGLYQSTELHNAKRYISCNAFIDLARAAIHVVVLNTHERPWDEMAIPGRNGICHSGEACVSSDQVDHLTFPSSQQVDNGSYKFFWDLYHSLLIGFQLLALFALLGDDLQDAIYGQEGCG